MNTAMPAELRTWRAALSFSSLVVKIQPKTRSPIQVGVFGLPVVRLYSPSPVRTAAAPLKRIQALSSLTKAASAAWAMLP